MDIDALKQLPGFQLDATLEMLGGNRDIFAMVMAQFKVEFGNWQFAMSQADLEGQITLAHSLKGAASNVGAITLYEHASELEHALRNEAPYDTALIDTQASLDALLNLL